MSRSALAVSVDGGSPATLPGHAIEVDAGVALPVAFSGLRKILQACEDAAPEVVRGLARARPSEWNRIFPGSMQDAPDLSDLALSPSERRLHRESEQSFWILNLAARAIVETLRASERPLVLHGAGECDLVSLRAVMRAAEWGRMEQLGNRILLTGMHTRRPHYAALFEQRRREYLEALCERMQAPPPGWSVGPTSERRLEAPVDLEGRYLLAVVDEERPLEHRIAAALLAIRACFFTTNYEGTLLAAERGLALLDAAGPGLSSARVHEGWDALDNGFVTPAIEIDRNSLGDADTLRALFERSIGVVHSYSFRNEAAMEAFGRGLECRISPEIRSHLHMFRALASIKRIGQLPQARAEAEAGLAALQGRETPSRYLHEAWLRNVYALTFFQEKNLERALVEEKLAMRCVGDLHDASATHLKINLISTASVLQETAKKWPEAIATWRRFEAISAKWGVNFTKHHCYRLAGLQLGAGDREAAVANFTKAYESAGQLGDAFHRQVIAAEMGRLYLDVHQPAHAAEWFSHAAAHAREFGDPLRLAQSLAGQLLADGGQDWTEVRRCATASTTCPRELNPLTKALTAGDLDAVRLSLPRPRSKLNRPFDLVMLD
jgi:tetratricopeptide (TPR) repeat protein